MTNLLERAIDRNDADDAAEIIRNALGIESRAAFLFTSRARQLPPLNIPFADGRLRPPRICAALVASVTADHAASNFSQQQQSD